MYDNIRLVKQLGAAIVTIWICIGLELAFIYYTNSPNLQSVGIECSGFNAETDIWISGENSVKRKIISGDKINDFFYMYPGRFTLTKIDHYNKSKIIDSKEYTLPEEKPIKIYINCNNNGRL